MFLYKSNIFSIYFGDASDLIFPQDYLTTPADIFFAKTPSIQNLMTTLALQELYFAQQVHGINGIQVTPYLLSGTSAFTTQADFVHTRIPAIGIGVMTADCLPIVFVDLIQKAVAIIHAGWRGAIHNIAQEALRHMHTAYGTKPPHILIFLGPSARVCCYQVGPEFVAMARRSPYGRDTLSTHDGRLFFDVPRLVCNQLIAAGVSEAAISYTYNICTICDTHFFSHRRDAQRSGRQMTVVTIV